MASYLREEKGYLLVRVYLPQQDVTEGIIEIRVIVGTLESRTDIRLKQPARVRPWRLEGIAEQAIEPGQAVQLKRIERAVLLMGDLPGITAQASLEKGDKPGTTRLVINAIEGPLVSGGLETDNYGDRYTGVYRGTANLNLNDPKGLADQFAISYVRADSLAQGRLSYQLPLGCSGLKWSFEHSYLRYRVGRELEDLQSKGWARTTATGLSYPLLRSRAASISAGVEYEYLEMRDELADVRTRERELPVGNLSLTGSFFDDLGGGGLSSVNLACYRGDLDLERLTEVYLADASTARSAGHFQRCTYSAARLQRLSPALAFYGAVRGQLATANLDSSQKIILGGPGGVRAYPVGEAAGDEGHVLNAELRYDLPLKNTKSLVQLVGFVDSGVVKLHERRWAGSITNAKARNSYRLAGTGAAVDFSRAGLYSLRLAYAHKLGNNPGRNVDDTDSDNHHDHGRLWFQGAVWF